MSWFFGKKKHHKDSPPSSPETEMPPGGESDGFIFVEKRGGRPGDSNPGEGSDPPPTNIYPNISGVPGYPPAVPTAVPKQTIDPIQNLLNNLPFKLCKQLTSNMNDDMMIETQRINEILTFIIRIEDDDILYDFSLENSVINEMDSGGRLT